MRSIVSVFARRTSHIAHRTSHAARLSITALVFGASLALPAAHAQIVTNGSFENGLFTGTNPASNTPNVTDLAPGATDITGWTVLSSGSDIGWLQNNNIYGHIASDGIRSLDLTGYRDASPYGGVSQILALTQGSTYTLRFDAGSQQSNSFFRGPVTVRAVVGSLDQLFTFTPPVGSTGQQWGTFTSNFTATSASQLLTLSGASTAGGQYIGLDNVSVTATGAPEPGTIALALVGSGPLLLGLARRQRRCKATKQAAQAQ